MIRVGPAGLGGAKEAIENLQRYHELGIRACEVAFTYGVYLKEKDATEIGKKAKELDIKLSIHAPYWINLNSQEKKKVEESKRRILECCKIGHALKAYLVVFHPGYYGKADKEETFENIKKAVLEIKKEIKKNRWKINIAAETTGKVNVFGSVEEIRRLVDETSCYFCIDFAHILAREKHIDYNAVLKKFSGFRELHIHFSGIKYGEKGERRHLPIDKRETKKMLESLPKNKEIVIINESPKPVKDSVKMLSLMKTI